mmetsp:Transcript_33310/g.100620  ORF Transcript_33310/g.100620 Transcript_33310/m.100620 type:complete len:168 (-) Transcript_33310:30-533(-)
MRTRIVEYASQNFASEFAEQCENLRMQLEVEKVDRELSSVQHAYAEAEQSLSEARDSFAAGNMKRLAEMGTFRMIPDETYNDQRAKVDAAFEKVRRLHREKRQLQETQRSLQGRVERLQVEPPPPPEERLAEAEKAEEYIANYDNFNKKYDIPPERDESTRATVTWR